VRRADADYGVLPQAQLQVDLALASDALRLHLAQAVTR